MSNKSNLTVAMMGIDSVGLDGHGAIVVRQKWSRGPLEARLAKMPLCLIGMEARAGAHHLSRRLRSQGHDARLMPAKYVRPYSKGQKNDFRDAEAIAEAVRRPTMKFGATKTAAPRRPETALRIGLEALMFAFSVRSRVARQLRGIACECPLPNVSGVNFSTVLAIQWWGSVPPAHTSAVIPPR
jgi:transposase